MMMMMMMMMMIEYVMNPSLNNAFVYLLYVVVWSYFSVSICVGPSTLYLAHIQYYHPNENIFHEISDSFISK